MTTKLSSFRKEQQITSVRLLSNTNVSGTYNNGPSNNGVGATLTIAASTLTIDSVACVNGDRVALINQTNTYENGIYQISGVGSAVILTRTYDFQTFDQMVPGYYLPVAAGTVYGGAMFGIIEPQVQVVGVDAILFVDASSSPTSVTLANNGLRVLDTNGSHYLQITPGSDLTANRIFTLVTGDAARTLTLGSNVSLDQNLQIADSPTFAGVTLGNTGLHLLDTNASHDLVIVPGSDLTADRNFTITTGDSARTLTMTGDATLNQDVSSTANPAFASVTVNNTGLHILDTNASHDLIIAPGSDLTADHTLTLTTGDADRTLTISGNATVNQDVSTTANAVFATVTVNNTGLHVLDTDASHDLIIIPGTNLTADRNLTISSGDANRALDISAADVTISSFGASLVDDAAASNARTTLQIFSAVTGNIGGAGAGPISVVVAGMSASSTIVGTLESSSNAVQVQTIVATATGFDVTFSGDPGASAILNYIAVGA